MIADMHCHIDLYPDYLRVLSEASERNVWILAVTTTPKAYPGTVQRLRGFTNVRVALGLHPELAHLRSQELDLWEEFARTTPFIGEIGLDGTPAYHPHQKVQQQTFRHILRLCRKSGGKILSIHSRGAATDVLDCLSTEGEVGLPILHWFSGTKKELEQAKALNCWFSVGAAMLHTRSGQERVRLMPPDRVLLETDGPFGMIDKRALRPSDIYAAMPMIGAVWRMTASEIEGRLLENQREIWRCARIAVG